MTYKLALYVFIALSLLTCDQRSESQEVLFVCTHGAARSPIAAAYFNKLALENDLNFHAEFRGTEADEVLTKETIIGLSGDNFSLDNMKPENVSDSDIEDAYKIVTFDCTLPNFASSSKVVEWNGTPSISKDYSVARDAIKERVEVLIEKLKKEK